MSGDNNDTDCHYCSRICLAVLDGLTFDNINSGYIARSDISYLESHTIARINLLTVIVTQYLLLF